VSIFLRTHAGGHSPQAPDRLVLAFFARRLFDILIGNGIACLRTQRRELMNTSQLWYQSCFVEPLVDLGDCEAEAFRGVLTPTREVGQQRHGVNAVFLENAEAYYKKYEGFAYWRVLLVKALDRIKIADPEIIVEYGCGFGNATLPIFDLLPGSRIIASDISPNLLAILDGLLVSRQLKDRCVAVAMDALKPYLR
jgi:hypothetical protein